MYKLLIVDDDEFEREGMVSLIPWAEYDIELAGTAWNGGDGYSKIKELAPDIVLTDIKMPVMNGIELIRKTRRDYPEIEFIVLSGYGEYEYTSQAMEGGVQFYILKPCDEVQIAEVIRKVKKKIQAGRSRKRQEEETKHVVRQFMPKAREQVFQNLMLGRTQLNSDYRKFMEECGEEKKSIRLLSLRDEKTFDELEQFILANVLGECLGMEKLLISTVVQKDALFLIQDMRTEEIERAVLRTGQELQRFRNAVIIPAVSEAAGIDSLAGLYQQVQELYHIGKSQQEGRLLHYGLFRKTKEEVSELVDCEKIKNSEDFGEILFEIYLSFLKMELRRYRYIEKKGAAEGMIKIICGGDDAAWTDGTGDEAEKTWNLLEGVVRYIADDKGIAAGNKEEERVKNILLSAYRYIRDPEVNIQFLAKNVLYMNEEYFGRIFVKNRKVKFNTYLLEQRINLAKRLLRYDPNMKLYCLAEMVGFLPDGQYFSKAFKKVTGKLPSEYREDLKEEGRKHT